MRILVVEDENQAARRLIKLVKELIPDCEIFGNLDSVISTVDWLKSHSEPDLIFLDIQLADGIAFEIFEKVKVAAPIIFCTAFDQYAIKAFKLNSIDYLLKPVEPQDLKQALDKFRQGRKSSALSLDDIKMLLQKESKVYKNRFLVKSGERILTLNIDDIAFFYSEDKVSLLQTNDGKKFVIDYILDELEEMIDPEKFFRLNRKYIASLQAIKGIYTYSSSRLKIQLVHCNDQDILVSREKVGSFKIWLGQ